MSASLARGRYHLIDEPTPSPLARSAVRPLFVLLGGMLGGTWLAVPWFILNSAALGSPTRRRETLMAIGSAIGSLLIAIAILRVADRFEFGRRSVEFALLALTGWKLFTYYALHSLQSRTYEIRAYYQGPGRNGLIVAIGGMLLRGKLLAQLPVLWVLVLVTRTTSAIEHRRPSLAQRIRDAPVVSTGRGSWRARGSWRCCAARGATAACG
jgi:hypothetical protein